MAKKTAEEKAQAKQAKADAKAAAKAEKGSVAPVAPEAKVLPMHEGLQVVEVLEQFRVAGHHSCKMSNGTTMDVPAELFN